MKPENCRPHKPDGWRLDEEHYAFLITNCEHCGAELLATEINQELFNETGEISVTNWIEER